MQKSRLRLLDKVVRLQGYERVLASQLDDTAKIFGTDELTSDEPLPHATDFVTIEIADQFVHKFRSCGGLRTDAVLGQLLENGGAIDEGTGWRHQLTVQLPAAHRSGPT